MLIHDVGDFGMLIVGIQAGPSYKWHLLLRSFGFDSSTTY